MTTAHPTPRPLSRRDVAGALRAVIPASSRVAVLHSSVKAIAGRGGHVDRAALIGGASDLVSEGLTLLLPAFTFSFTRGVPFDIARSGSETGRLADWVRELPHARRTPSPMYSFAVLGPLASAFVAADHEDAYGPASVLGLLESRDATIVSIGCGWNCCTFLHRIEDEAHVPYRQHVTFSGTADLGRGSETTRIRVFVREPDSGTLLDFGKMGPIAASRGVMRRGMLGAAVVEAVQAADLARLGRELVGSDPWFLLDRNRRRLSS